MICPLKQVATSRYKRADMPALILLCALVLCPHATTGFVIAPSGMAPGRLLSTARPCRATSRQAASLDPTSGPESALSQQLGGGEGFSVEAEAAEGLAAPESLWTWRAVMLGITVCWGSNFAVIRYAMDALGGGADDSALFVAARFGVAALALAPFMRGMSAPAARAGANVGLWVALGYAAQAAALEMGTTANKAAFICSLQAVFVALLGSLKPGGAPVATRTWGAVALAVAGVGCLELPSALADGGPAIGLGDIVALGQPLGFGISYLLLEAAMEEHPEDGLSLSAVQCAVVGTAAIGAAGLVGGGGGGEGGVGGMHFSAPWELPWGHLLPSLVASVDMDSAAASVAAAAPAAWAVPACVAFTGLVSTALTVWLCALTFKRLPAVDASLILTTEPL